MLARERHLPAVLLEPRLLGGVVVDLFATPFLAAPVQHDHCATQRELARDLALERFEVVAVDVERERADAVVGRHAHEPTCPNLIRGANQIRG